MCATWELRTISSAVVGLVEPVLDITKGVLNLALELID
jgi:hypothetical protein